MKIEYMLAFLGGVELMALANALSLGLLPCRFLALISMFLRTSCHSVTVKNRCTSQANSLSFPMRRLQLSAGTWEHSTTHSAAATGD